MQRDATTPNIVGSAIFGIVVSMLAVVCKGMQQLPTLLGRQCLELLYLCWQWYAKGCNNSQHCWVSNVWNYCVHAGSGVQRDATTPNSIWTCSASWKGLLRPIRPLLVSKKKCWGLLVQEFYRFQTLRNNSQQHATTYIWELFTNNVVSVCMWLNF